MHDICDRPSLSEKYAAQFPSDALLTEMYGPEADLIDREFQDRQRILAEHQVGVLVTVFGMSDVAIAHAIDIGEIEAAVDENGVPTLRYNESVFKAHCHPFRRIRRLFDQLLRSGLMHIMRANLLPENADSDIKKIFIFKDGQFGEVVRLRAAEMYGLDLDMPSDQRQRLRQEFASWCVSTPFYADWWWRWVVADDSVWMEVDPDKLAEEQLIRARKKSHDPFRESLIFTPLEE